jgi:hypothetical protein
MNPITPTTSRMTPAVWMLKPETVASTAQTKTAPAAARTRERLMPIVDPPLSKDGLSYR